jgi:hypothetical protein
MHGNRLDTARAGDDVSATSYSAGADMSRLPTLLSLLAILGTPLHAQGDLQREGAWGSFLLGAGSVGVSCGFCPTDRQWGPSGMFAVGGTISRQILLGGGTSVFGRTSETADTYLGWAYGLIRAYPSASINGFVSGGAGLNYGRGTSSTDDYQALGAGFLVGLGWDFGLGESFALTAFANALFSAGGYLEQNGVQASNSSFNPTLFQFGLGVTLF